MQARLLRLLPWLRWPLVWTSSDGRDHWGHTCRLLPLHFHGNLQLWDQECRLHPQELLRRCSAHSRLLKTIS